MENYFKFPFKIQDSKPLTASDKLEPLPDDAILDLAALSHHGTFAQEAAGHLAALPDGHVVHGEAVGDADLLLHLAVGAQGGALGGGLVGHERVLADQALGANLGQEMIVILFLVAFKKNAFKISPVLWVGACCLGGWEHVPSAAFGSIRTQPSPLCWLVC